MNTTAVPDRFTTLPDEHTPQATVTALEEHGLRHTFVSLMSDSGVPVEEIARLAGQTNSRTTELVYRHQLRPIMERGVQALDQLFPRTA